MTIRSSRMLAIAALAAALSLGACKKDEINEKNADPATVAAKVAASAERPQPGRWETTMKLESIDMPGMPPEARAMMEKQLGSRKLVTCLSPEEAARPNAEFFSGERARKAGCKYDNFTMGDGKLDAIMSCAGAEGTMKMTLAGTYGAEDYEVHANSTMSAPGGSMNQAMTMTAHRTGDCKGDEINAKKG